ncbi:nuclear hormone receptor FTZ-F1-like [Pollicipes pollicipes]|nr:nuclear hormone receptor FTZ-F1-like [Pollicipes pollicipes]
MKLLQATWSVIMILDHIHQRLHNNLPDSTTLPNGQKFDLLTLSLFGMTELVPQLNDVTARLQELSFDVSDYICLKFVLLLDPNMQTLGNRRHVQQAQDQVKQAHMDYCSTVHTDIQGKYQRLMALLPELRELALRGEDYLYQKHDTNSATSLLIEMLHARRLLGRVPAQ